MIDIWFLSVITLLFVIILFHVLVEYIDKNSTHNSDSIIKNFKDNKNRNNFVGADDTEMQTQVNQRSAVKIVEIMRIYVVPIVFFVFNVGFWICWFA